MDWVKLVIGLMIALSSLFLIPFVWASAEDSCNENNGYLIYDENGVSLCIVNENNQTPDNSNRIIEKVPKEYLSSDLAYTLYPQNPAFAMTLLILLTIGMLMVAIKTFGFKKDSDSLKGKLKVVFALLLLSMLVVFVYKNLSQANYKNIPILLWPSFPLGGLAIIGLGGYLAIWLLFAKKVHHKGQL